MKNTNGDAPSRVAATGCSPRLKPWVDLNPVDLPTAGQLGRNAKREVAHALCSLGESFAIADGWRSYCRYGAISGIMSEMACGC